VALVATTGRACGCFFFQAEDGIRDRNVTGVQTCALPIFLERSRNMHLIKDENGNPVQHGHEHTHSHGEGCENHSHDHCGICQGGDCKNETTALLTYMLQHNEHHAQELEIGRAHV